MTEKGGETPRLTTLEETVSHQMRAIEDMSGEMAAMAAEIRALRARLDALAKRLVAIEDSAGEAPPVTRPPHW